MNTFSKTQKAHWIKVMQEHQDADRIIQGLWWSDGKGCFFGCAMQTQQDVVRTASKEMNLPSWLVVVLERMFEHLPRDKALTFPVRALEAIPTDTDISSLHNNFNCEVVYNRAIEDPSFKETFTLESAYLKESENLLTQLRKL